MLALLLALQVSGSGPAPSEPVIPEPALVATTPVDASKPVQAPPAVTWSAAVQQSSTPLTPPNRVAAVAAAALNAATSSH